MKKEFKDKASAEEFYQKLRNENKYEFDAYLLPNGAGYGLQWIESKTYVSHDGKEYPDEAWLTEAGELILVQDLSEAHAKNIIRMMIRKDRAAYEMIADLISSGEINPEDSVTIEAPQHTLH